MGWRGRIREQHGARVDDTGVQRGQVYSKRSGKSWRVVSKRVTRSSLHFLRDYSGSRVEMNCKGGGCVERWVCGQSRRGKTK